MRKYAIVAKNPGTLWTYQFARNISPTLQPKQYWVSGEVHSVTESCSLTIPPSFSGTAQYCFGGNRVQGVIVEMLRGLYFFAFLQVSRGSNSKGMQH